MSQMRQQTEESELNSSPARTGGTLNYSSSFLDRHHSRLHLVVPQGDLGGRIEEEVLGDGQILRFLVMLLSSLINFLKIYSHLSQLNE